MIKKVLMYLWQLPQNLLGLLITKVLNSHECEFRKQLPDGSTLCITYYVIDHMLVKYSAQYGQYTIVPPKNDGREITLRHESLGHGKQSKITGPLYLLIVGLPSVIRNRISVGLKKPSSWYYGFGKYAKRWAYPEKWADKLGGVVRV